MEELLTKNMQEEMNITPNNITNNSLLRCDICKITLKDKSILESHFTGKRHQKAVRNVDLKAQQEGKAVYLTGLGELQLSEVHGYMSSFGTVVNLAVGKNKDIPGRMHHVIVEFESEDPVARILSKDMRGKHTIEVSGSDPPKSQTIKIFERKFKDHRPRSPSPEVCCSVSHDQVKLRLALIEDCEEQLEELVTLTNLDKEDVQLRVDICKNIQKTFSRSQFSSCVVYPFGSSVNGLGFPGCDLDIFLELTAHLETPRFNSPSKSNLLDDIPVAMTEQQKVKVAMKVLREIPQCARLNPILAARVPILKFIHRPSGIHCDVSFKNRGSVRNTEYIRFCTETDSRVRPLMVTVRYMAKHYSFAGGGGGMKLSNYALTMMVIVYLQQLDQPLLHSVLELQSVEGLEMDIINNWNCNFCHDFTKIRCLPVNNSTTLELLTGFFQFVSGLDLPSVVLCPLLGKVVPKSVFQSPTSLQTTFPGIPSFVGPSGLQTEKPICLQDPFELTHNVCRNLPEKAVKNIVNYMREAGKVVSSCLIETTKPVGGLMNLFSLEIPVEAVGVDDFETALNGLAIEKRGFFMENIALPVSKEYLDWFCETMQKSDTVKGGDGKRVECLVECGAYLVEVALGDCLKMIEQEKDIDDLDQEMPTEKIINTKDSESDERKKDQEPAEQQVKRSLSDNSAKIPSKRVRLETIPLYKLCAVWTVWSQVWVGRKRISGTMEQDDLSTVEWESRITDKVVEGVPRMLEPELAFTVHLMSMEGLDVVWVGLEKIQARKKSFENFATWLRSFLPDLVGRLVKEKVDQILKEQEEVNVNNIDGPKDSV